MYTAGHCPDKKNHAMSPSALAQIAAALPEDASPSLIQPHGGVLKELYLPPDEAAANVTQLKRLLARKEGRAELEKMPIASAGRGN